MITTTLIRATTIYLSAYSVPGPVLSTLTELLFIFYDNPNVVDIIIPFYR